MDKSTILELRDYIQNKVKCFCEYYKNENIDESSYSDWNARDIIGHINAWIKFSEEKLEEIKTKKSFNIFNNIEISIDDFNQINYEKYKYKTLKNVEKEILDTLNRYSKIIALFNEHELMNEEYQTGFSVGLWKYMAIDLGIHPITHILYHHLRRKNYSKFIDELEKSKKYYIGYSKNYIKEYNFKELFENNESTKEIFKELLEISKENKFIEEIIKFNME